MVPVVVVVAVLLRHSPSLANVPLLWERQITSHDGSTVGTRSKSFCAVVDKTSCGGGWNAPSVLPR